MLETAVGVGSVLRLVRDGRASTRTELARQSGLSRSTLAERVQALLALDLLQETTGSASTGGRPPATLTFNRAAGCVLVADFDVTRCRIAACDLGAVPLAEAEYTYDPGAAPEAILAELHHRFVSVLLAAGVAQDRVRGVGIGLPASLAELPGWSGLSVPDWFSAPVLLDGHVNLMALGERWTHWRDVDHLLFVAVGTRIDCGIVSEGRVHRGARGTAGDIGHMPVAGHDVDCRCGNVGCLEAVAGAGALAAGLEVTSAAEVVSHVRAGTPAALQATRAAGRAIGEVLAACITFYNPAVIVLGGELAGASEPLLAGVREAAFARSPPMATRELRMSLARLGERAGLIGAAVMVVEHVLAPEYVDRLARAS